MHHTLIFLSCVQVGVQSVPFCFHAGTALKDGQIISHFYVYTTVSLRLLPDRQFLHHRTVVNDSQAHVKEETLIILLTRHCMFLQTRIMSREKGVVLGLLMLQFYGVLQSG